MAEAPPYWSRVGAQRFSRRRALQSAAVAAGGLAVMVAGCGGKKQTATANKPSGGAGAVKQPKKGGILTYAGGSAGSNDTQGRTFDPMIQTQWSSKAYSLFYERLLGYNLRSYTVEAELAQKWEQPSQTEYLFHLQPGVRWQNKPPANGRPLTVEDIVWSLERARTNDPKFYSRSLLAGIDRIDAPDSSTVRITTNGPNVSTLKALSVDNLAILAKELIEKYPKPTSADSAVGTGAFMMSSEEDHVGATYVRNPAYWKPGLPYLDGFRTPYFADYQIAWSAFLAGQVDITLIPGSEVKGYLAQQGAGYTPAWYPDDTFRFMYPNTKRKPMDDARVTRALKLLVDHDEFISAWAEPQVGKGGYGSIFPTALSAWDLTPDEYKTYLEWKQPKDDAAKAAISLLNAAGFTKDNPLKFTMDIDSGQPSRAQGQLLQAQWGKWSQGIVDAQLKVNQGPAGDAIRAQRAFTYFCAGLSTGLVDPDIWLTNIYHSNGSLNCAIPANRYFLQAVKPKVQNQAPEYFLNGRQYQSVWLAS